MCGTGEKAVLGILSLIAWALILVITVKYVAVIMRGDNRSEGGLLALTALTNNALDAIEFFRTGRPVFF